MTHCGPSACGPPWRGFWAIGGGKEWLGRGRQRLGGADSLAGDAFFALLRLGVRVDREEERERVDLLGVRFRTRFGVGSGEGESVSFELAGSASESDASDSAVTALTTPLISALALDLMSLSTAEALLDRLRREALRLRGAFWAGLAGSAAGTWVMVADLGVGACKLTSTTSSKITNMVAAITTMKVAAATGDLKMSPKSPPVPSSAHGG